MKKIRVGLIFGGRSGEHEVSLMSAQGVLGAIDPERFDVVPIGITKEGRWIASGDPIQALTTGHPSASQYVSLLPEPSQRGLMPLDVKERTQVLTSVGADQLDVLFPILHGPYGEDGTVQGLLELAGIPYVGAGVAASAVGMDKILFKDIMVAHGLPIPPHRMLLRRAWEKGPERLLDALETEIGYPCFVKPANLGSSVGISKAHNRSELRAALHEAARFDRKLLVEAAIDAREIEISILGNDDPIASVPGEIVPCNEFYDYAAKYLDEDSELLIPAPIPSEIAAQVASMAIKAYRAIDCAGMARVDFLLDRRTDRLYINEVNTLPGFTPISMYAKLWEASGISYPELIERLIHLALERHADKQQSVTSYDIPKG